MLTPGTKINVKLSARTAERVIEELEARRLEESREPVVIPVVGSILNRRGVANVEFTINLSVETDK